jgi:hypothetical protein
MNSMGGGREPSGERRYLRVNPGGELNLRRGKLRGFRFVRRGFRKENLKARSLMGMKSKEGALNQYGATS